ncbi:hypothetical protein A9B99_04100 [Mangrovibacter phragmitis]|uniref:Uncharacterized protein n=1 Tax=Mangrovibacter phragmitis TaxID=1691903 RepID=A0A1B7L9H6_9ENTR|nr:hypothetical protein A9B99_04100 [Mangrovibacter phragmitis]
MAQATIHYYGITVFEQLENLFLDPLLTALDEYGIPTQISTQLKNLILPSEHLSGSISQSRTAPTDWL